MYKKIVAQGNEKKNHARQLTLKNIHTTAKKDSYKEFDNEKKKMIMLFLFFGENTVSKP